jgi:hypothetical protein
MKQHMLVSGGGFTIGSINQRFNRSDGTGGGGGLRNSLLGKYLLRAVNLMSFRPHNLPLIMDHLIYDTCIARSRYEKPDSSAAAGGNGGQSHPFQPVSLDDVLLTNLVLIWR